MPKNRCAGTCTAALFGVQIPGISKHINNIFESGELDSSTTLWEDEERQSDKVSVIKCFMTTVRIVEIKNYGYLYSQQ